MSALFGSKYFGFIAGAYGVTATVLLVLVVWVLVTQRRRQRALNALEKAGMRRAGRNG